MAGEIQENMSILRKTIKFFDRLEDKVRGRLSHYPVLYAFMGGIGVVLFWRGVWHTADGIEAGSAVLGGIISLTIGSIILLLTGVFVSAFVGNKLIISGLIGEKKLEEKEQGEIQSEETQIKNMQSTLSRLEEKLDYHIDQEESK